MLTTPAPTTAEATARTPLMSALAALQDHEDSASRWLDVAIEFRAAGLAHQAIEACEASLKLDPKSVEAWVMIAGLARAVGHEEIADEAVVILRNLAPDDARISSL